MNRVIFVGFDTEQKAYDADRALHEMHRDGSLTLYGAAVVAKDHSGAVAIRELPDEGPLGTVTGMVTGGLIGLIGGPVGAVVGMSSGTLVGAAFDLARDGIDTEFVEDAGAHLDPGKAAVIAEIDESWEVPLDTRMEALGGKVIRRTRTQIEDAIAEREIETTEKELRALEAEKVANVEAAATEKANKQTARLQTKIDAARQKIRDKEAALAARTQSVKDEGEERIAVLEAQKATATREAKEQLEQRLANMRSDYAQRVKRLEKSLAQIKKFNVTEGAK
jgi:uncharacterized membrane protein